MVCQQYDIYVCEFIAATVACWIPLHAERAMHDDEMGCASLVGSVGVWILHQQGRKERVFVL